MTGLRPSWVSCGLVVLLAIACETDGDDEGAGETGTETGDGDGDPGDGDGDPGDGDGDTFAGLCLLGCEHFLDCAPVEFAQLYPDVDTCTETCLESFGGCVAEANIYFDCFVGLSCADVVVAVTQGPGATTCGSAYDAATTACGG